MPGTRLRLKADLPPGPALALIALCVYEPVALVTPGLPTVSELCRRHRLLEAAFVITWFAHIHLKVKVVECP